MAELNEELDGDEAVERSNFIAGGSYNVQAINSNRKDKETGLVQLGFQFQVLDGERENQTFWLSFNFKNPKSQQNEDISRDQLKQIAKACGVGIFKTTEELHHKPFNMSVKVVEKDGYTNNSMTGCRPFKNPGEEPAPKSATKPKTEAKAATPKTEAKAEGKPSQGGSKPWDKNKKK